MGEGRYRDRQWVKGETGKTGMVWRQERQKRERYRDRQRETETDRQTERKDRQGEETRKTNSR